MERQNLAAVVRVIRSNKHVIKSGSYDIIMTSVSFLSRFIYPRPTSRSTEKSTRRKRESIAQFESVDSLEIEYVSL